VVVFVILSAVSGWIFRSSRREHVGAHNVNDHWERQAEVTSPAYEHARPEHPETVAPAAPTETVAPAPPTEADDPAPRADEAAPTETKIH
jgi:hypothetical protein